MEQNGKYFGTFKHKIDKSNRLSLSSKLIKNEDTGVLFVSLGFDKDNLILRTSQELDVFFDKLLALKESKKSVREIRRVLLANTYRLEIDKQNRIILPQILIKKTKIQSDVTLVGNINQIEIWDTNQFDKQQEILEEKYSDILEAIDEN